MCRSYDYSQLTPLVNLCALFSNYTIFHAFFQVFLPVLLDTAGHSSLKYNNPLTILD